MKPKTQKKIKELKEKLEDNKIQIGIMNSYLWLIIGAFFGILFYYLSPNYTLWFSFFPIALIIFYLVKKWYVYSSKIINKELVKLRK